jgi:hypothetical protein
MIKPGHRATQQLLFNQRIDTVPAFGPCGDRTETGTELISGK